MERQIPLHDAVGVMQRMHADSVVMSPSSQSGRFVSTSTMPDDYSSGRAAFSVNSDTSSAISQQLDLFTGLHSVMKIKLLVHYHGDCHQEAGPDGDCWVYRGGETRLVTFVQPFSYTHLMDVLSHYIDLSSDDKDALQLRYALPDDESVLVDVKQDLDVANMVEEVVDARAEKASFKLKFYICAKNLLVDDSAFTSNHSQRYGSLQNSGQSDTSHGSHPALGVQHHGSFVHVSNGGMTSAGPAAIRSSDFVRAENALAESGHGDTDVMPLKYLERRLELIKPSQMKLKRFLGAGGYGEVYLAEWHGMNVAVKCLNLAVLDPRGKVNRSVIAELIKEADLLSGLKHENIVWVYGLVLHEDCIEEAASEAGAQLDAVDAAVASATDSSGIGGNVIRPPALVAEYMSNGSLRFALTHDAKFMSGSRANLLRIKLCLDCAKGMEYLHSKRIVHFDLKSGNLLLRYQDNKPLLKVSDFGLSKQKQQTYVSGVSTQRGTLPWTAPEIIRTPDKVNEKVDVYSFGVVMWEVWTGMEPFEGENYHALLLKLTTNNVRPPIPGAPDWVAEACPQEPVRGYSDLMQRCWDSDPEARPSFQQIVKDLGELLVKAHRERLSMRSGALSGGLSRHRPLPGRPTDT